MSQLRGAIGAVVAVFLPFALASGQEPSDAEPMAEGPPPVAMPPNTPPTSPGKEDSPGGFGGPGMGGGGSRGPGYSATWYPSRPVAGQTTDLGLVRQSLILGVPLWRDGGNMLMLTGGVRNSVFFTDAVLPDTGRAFPDELWNVNLGLNYLHKFDGGCSAGLMAGVGSASDRPFDSIREMNVMASAFLRVPARNERDAWLLSVFYSPAGNLNFPIPGIAYVWNPSDDLRVQIGLPFALMWRPVEGFTIDLSYVPLTNINARATYRVAEALRFYAGYEFLNEAYFLADRADSRDRFMAFEQRVIGGVCWDLWRNASLDVNAGYVFDRRYGEARNQGGTLHDRVDVAPGAFLGAALRVRF